MPRRFSTDEVVRALQRLDFTPTRQRGSHIRLSGRFRGATRFVTVPRVRGAIDPGTLGSILRQTGLTKDELDALTKGMTVEER